MLIYTAQKFKIPDFIGDGKRTVSEIASYTETESEDKVERLMYALAAEGYFTLLKERVFANNELSVVLRRDHPVSMAAHVGHNVEVCWTAWGKFAELFGPNGIDCPWDEANPQYAASAGNGGFFGSNGLMASDPVQEEQFMRAMAIIEGSGGEAMAKGGPFERFSRIVDVGGSRGHFLVRLLRMYPGKTGIVVDRPPVIQMAMTKNAENEEINDVIHKIGYFGGDFFDETKMPEIEDGDVLMMRHILHDWSDADSLRILQTLRAVIGDKKASLLIGECAMPDRDQLGISEFGNVHRMDLEMMVSFAAKERTPKEWRALLAAGHFNIDAFHSTESCVHWIECSPK